MALNRFQNNLRFALRKELSENRAHFPPNRSEQIGNFLSWFAYEFRSMVMRVVRDPRFATVCLTFLAMVLTSLLFYPSITWENLMRVTRSIVHHIPWSYFRFTLWMLSELTILGIGFRAFGRFSNRKLMEFHGILQ